MNKRKNRGSRETPGEKLPDNAESLEESTRSLQVSDVRKTQKATQKRSELTELWSDGLQDGLTCNVKTRWWWRRFGVMNNNQVKWMPKQTSGRSSSGSMGKAAIPCLIHSHFKPFGPAVEQKTYSIFQGLILWKTLPSSSLFIILPLDLCCSFSSALAGLCCPLPSRPPRNLSVWVITVVYVIRRTSMSWWFVEVIHGDGRLQNCICQSGWVYLCVCI